MKLLNLVLSFFLLFGLLGCNNPSGDSVLSADHVPLLKAPGEFNFTNVQVKSRTASLHWDAALRTSEYRVYYGNSTQSMTTELQSCRGLSRSCSLNELEKGVSYYFKVVAYNLGGATTISTIRHVRIIAPFNLTSLITGTEANQLIVNFPQDTIGAENYLIRYGTDPNNLDQELSATSSPAVIPNLIGGDLYYVVVEASNTVGDGITVVSTNKLSETPLVKLYPPNTVATVAEPGKVNLTWSVAGGAKWYVILRKTTGGTFQQIATNVKVLNYSDTTVTNGVTYEYVVRSSNGADSEDSGSVIVKPIGAFTLGGATSITPTTASISWGTAVGADNYEVYLKTSGGAYSKLSTGTTKSYSFSNLSPGTTYVAKVVATNSVTTPLTTSSSNEVTFTTSPLAVSNLQANSNSSGNVSLTWTAPASSTPIVYTIMRGTTSGTYPTTLTSTLTGASYTDSTVTNGIEYYYIVIANNGTPSAPSAEVAKKPISSCGVTSTNALGKTSIQVNWSTCVGADVYSVIVSTSAGDYSTAAVKASLSAPVNSHVVTGLSSSTKYFIKINGKNNVGTGVNRFSTEVNQVTYPDPPSITINGGAGLASLSWTAVPTVTSYRILRGTQPGIYDTEFTTTSPSKVDTGLTNGQNYYYVVSSNNGYESENSTEIGVRPIANFSISSTQVTTSSITVNWPDTIGAETYIIQYRKGTDPFTTLNNQATGTVLSGLLSGTTYELRVVAKNTLGMNSTYVSTVSAYAHTTPSAPTLNSVASLNGSISLSWPAVTGGNQYRVYRSTTSGAYSFLTPFATVTTNSFTDSAVTPGVDYFYVISAFNGTESIMSNEVSANPIGALGVPVLTALSSSSMKVDWTAPVSASSYKVYYKLASNATYEGPIDVSATSYTLTGLEPGVSYQVYIKAQNSLGTSGASYFSPVSTKATLPSTISTLAVSSTDALKVNLSWIPVAGATKYNVYRRTSSGSLSYLGFVNGQSASSYLDTAVSAGTTYYYSVRPHNGSVEVSDSNIQSIKVIGAFNLTAVSAASSTSINVNWSSAVGADSFDVYYGPSVVPLFDLQDIGTSGSTSFTLTGLTPATLYYVKIRARNSEGGNVSSVVTLPMSVKTSPAAPVLSAVSVSSGTISFAVSNASGATSYNVYRSESSGGPYSQIASGKTGATFSDPNATNGKTWFYVVRSFNGTESANSNEVFARPLSPVAISPIEVISSSKLRISWAFTEASSEDEMTYILKWGTSSGNLSNSIDSASRSFELTGLDPNATYYFQVIATTSVGPGMSVTSGVVSGKTNNPPQITSVVDQTTTSNEAKTVSITISDTDDLLSCSSIVASSSDETIVSPSGLSTTGLANLCQLSITPEGVSGTTVITVSLSDTKDTASVSFNLSVTPCKADYIGWVTQPTSLNAGSTWTEAPKVVLRSQGVSGPVCDDDASPVFISVAKDPSRQQDAEISGLTKVIPTGGYAQFPMTGMNRSGSGFTLVASQGEIISEESNTFSVDPVSGSASQIIWAQQPVSSILSILHSADQYGNQVAPNEELEISISVYQEDGTFVSTLDNNPFKTSTGIVQLESTQALSDGTYYLRASSALGSISSQTFSVSSINQENTIAILEMLQGSIKHEKNYPILYQRSIQKWGTDSLNGTNTYKWRIVASHPDSGPASIVLREGATTKATINLALNSSVPTVYETSFSAPTLASGKWSLTVSGKSTVYSSKLIIEQKLATRSLTYIPLSSLTSDGEESISVSHSSLQNPDMLEYPTFTYDWSTLSRIEGAQLVMVSKSSSGNVCAQLFSKTNNSPIGNELCSGAGAESYSSLDLAFSELPTGLDQIEVRTRSINGEGKLYKVGLLLKYSAIENFLGVQRLAPRQAVTSSGADFVSQQGISLKGSGSEYSTNSIREDVFCLVRVTGSESGQLNLFTAPSSLVSSLVIPSSSGTYDLKQELLSSYPASLYLTAATPSANTTVHLGHCLLLSNSLGY